MLPPKEVGWDRVPMAGIGLLFKPILFRTQALKFEPTHGLKRQAKSSSLAKDHAIYVESLGLSWGKSAFKENRLGQARPI